MDTELFTVKFFRDEMGYVVYGMNVADVDVWLDSYVEEQFDNVVDYIQGVEWE